MAEAAGELGVPDWSYVPADKSKPVLETTVGGILRTAAARHPDRVALVESIRLKRDSAAR